MKLYVNGRFLGRRATGVERFGREMLLRIDAWAGSGLLKDFQIEILVPATASIQVEFMHLKYSAVGKLGGQAWEQLELPFYARKGLLLNLCNLGPLLAGRQVVCMHDAATSALPLAFSWRFRRWYSLALPILGKRAKKVVTISEFSAQELRRWYSVPKEKLTVVSEGGEHIRRVTAEPFPIALQEGRFYLLAVGSQAAHKNLKVVFEALSLVQDLPVDLILVGGANAGIFAGPQSSESERIIRAGYVSDGVLKSLYQRASAFLFPSLYEGFGIPPLEAMHCGCPVIASNAACMPEILGDAALFFDPHSAEALASQIRILFSDDGLRRNLSERGVRRAAHYSWDRGAKDLIQTCRDAAA